MDELTRTSVKSWFAEVRRLEQADQLERETKAEAGRQTQSQRLESDKRCVAAAVEQLSKR